MPPLRLFFLIAAFCRLAKSLSHSEQMGWLVGPVGIENNADRNSKDLEEMLGSAKKLKRNNAECKGILIGPLMAPVFLDHRDSLSQCISLTGLVAQSALGSNFAARMASRRNFVSVLDPNS